jgi:phospholipase C
MDKFVEFTSSEDGKDCDPNGGMAYFDGNTVTALWNYAQRFAMSDDSFGTGFGPSTPGAINLVAGNTHGAIPPDQRLGDWQNTARGTVIADPDPLYDDCSDPSSGLVAMSGRNVGDLLNEEGVTWGWFQGRFRPTGDKDGKVVCGAQSTNLVGKTVKDYSPHHEPFQYYQSTSNPKHWDLGRIGDQSLDEIAGTLDSLLALPDGGDAKPLVLDPKTGKLLDETQLRTMQ